MPEEYYDYSTDTEVEYEEPKTTTLAAPKKEKFGEKLQRWGGQYKQWKTERKGKELENLAYKAQKSTLQSQIQVSKSKIAMQKMELKDRRASLMAKQQRSMPQMPSMLGGGGGFGNMGLKTPKGASLMNPLGTGLFGEEKQRTRRKVHRRKVKPKIVYRYRSHRRHRRR